MHFKCAKSLYIEGTDEGLLQEQNIISIRTSKVYENMFYS